MVLSFRFTKQNRAHKAFTKTEKIKNYNLLNFSVLNKKSPFIYHERAFILIF